MRSLAVLAFLVTSGVAAFAGDAAAPMPATHPTAEQYQMQILQGENQSLRGQLANVAVQLDLANDRIAELKAKCGNACEAAAGKK